MKECKNCKESKLRAGNKIVSVVTLCEDCYYDILAKEEMEKEDGRIELNSN